MPSLTALSVFVSTYLACWAQMGYVHKMGTPQPFYHTRYQVQEIQQALARYREANGSFPDSLDALKGIEENGLNLQQYQLLDEWKRPFHYQNRVNRYELISLGRDGVPGGVGLDSDVTFDDGLGNAASIRLPLYQFALETAGGEIIFRMACLASIVAGAIWLVAKPKSTNHLASLSFNVAATTVSAVLVAAYLAAFHLTAFQSGH
ncbi:type II secretion system protein GspG [Planctomycetota bacterium]